MVRLRPYYPIYRTEFSTAWKINLNLSLTSFEDGISGVRTLVDFAITSPLARLPHLLFVSSISVFISAFYVK
jgi:hypothetical protein